MPLEEDEPQATCINNLLKFGHAVFELCKWTDRQTDILITILCTSPGGKVGCKVKIPWSTQWPNDTRCSLWDWDAMYNTHLPVKTTTRSHNELDNTHHGELCRYMFIKLHDTHTHTTILWLCGFCPGKPRWAGTRRNIHPLTPIVVIKYPYLPCPSMIHGILPTQSTCFTFFFHNLSPSFLWSTSWPGTLHFILHTFLHPIIVFFSQHVPIPSQPVLL